jgi:hypothetical protein
MAKIRNSISLILKLAIGDTLQVSLSTRDCDMVISYHKKLCAVPFLTCHAKIAGPSFSFSIPDILFLTKTQKRQGRSPALIDILVKKWSKVSPLFTGYPSIAHKRKKDLTI